MGKSGVTPLMQQWQKAKKDHPDALLAMKIGDFWEFMGEDAKEVARLLGITLTSRNNGSAGEVPLAGVPAKAGATYIQRLVAAGRRVAIMDQVEDPALAKGIVKREVIEVLTPGALLDEELLAERKNNFLASFSGTEGKACAIAYADISTGEVFVTLTSWDVLGAELARLEPSEILLGEKWRDNLDVGETATTYRPDWVFDPDLAKDEILRHYNLTSIDAFDLHEGEEVGVSALGGLLAYLLEVQPTMSENLRAPIIERPGSALVLDDMTKRNLEIVSSMRPDLAGKGEAREGTLLSIIDCTRTAMGGRLMRRWLLKPLVEKHRIEERLSAVEELMDRHNVLKGLRESMSEIRDIERLAGRLAAGRLNPRELRTLAVSLKPIPNLVAAMQEVEADFLTSLRDEIDTVDDICYRIDEALTDRPPLVISDGGVIREGYDEELDDLRATRDGAKDFIANLQKKEREKWNIPSLKIGYNKVFGYYIEITNTHADKVPEEYERKQTLKNAERYITTELKEWEAKVTGAEERIREIEARLFTDLRAELGREVARLYEVAQKIAVLDTIQSFAEVARKRNYVRPEFHDHFELDIVEGRHPVVEALGVSGEFIPNDIKLDKKGHVMILTGPNMAGKSTLLRQVGLIQLLAQVGAFVPATSAKLPVCDRIFTRVGASDNLVRGQSTFLVEMSEASQILHASTRKSLVLLDEIGRGTATYDGLSLAWAITEYLHDEIGAKTIFATHYHELTQLEEWFSGVQNANVAVKKVGNDVVFLRRVLPGGADGSYGIDVAKLAGLPEKVIGRARRVLAELERTHDQELGKAIELDGLEVTPQDQLALELNGHREPDPVRKQILDLDVSSTTPLEALTLIAELQKNYKEE